MGRIAYIGSDKKMRLMMNLVGVACFETINEIDFNIYSVALVEENIFKRLDLKKYFGKVLILPFRSSNKPLGKELWFEKMIMGEIMK